MLQTGQMTKINTKSFILKQRRRFLSHLSLFRLHFHNDYSGRYSLIPGSMLGVCPGRDSWPKVTPGSCSAWEWESECGGGRGGEWGAEYGWMNGLHCKTLRVDIKTKRALHVWALTIWKTYVKLKAQRAKSWPNASLYVAHESLTSGWFVYK